MKSHLEIISNLTLYFSPSLYWLAFEARGEIILFI